jgi:hypothetical protein
MASLRIQDSSTDYRLPHLPIRYSIKTRQVGLKTDTKSAATSLRGDGICASQVRPAVFHARVLVKGRDQHEVRWDGERDPTRSAFDASAKFRSRHLDFRPSER